MVYQFEQLLILLRVKFCLKSGSGGGLYLRAFQLQLELLVFLQQLFVSFFELRVFQLEKLVLFHVLPQVVKEIVHQCGMNYLRALIVNSICTSFTQNSSLAQSVSYAGAAGELVLPACRFAANPRAAAHRLFNGKKLSGHQKIPSARYCAEDK